MSRIVTKPTIWHVRPAKTQISLGIRTVWSESLLSAWRKLGSLATHWAHSEDSAQTGRKPRLTWAFVGAHAILLVLSRCGSLVTVTFYLKIPTSSNRSKWMFALYWVLRVVSSMSRDKTNRVFVRPAKTPISLDIRPGWSESSLCAQWVAKDSNFLHADSEDSDQTGRMPRLIWVFAGRTTTLLVLSWGGSFTSILHAWRWYIQNSLYEKQKTHATCLLTTNLL